MVGGAGAFKPSQRTLVPTALTAFSPISGWRDPETGGTLLHVAVVEENNFGASITRTLITAGVDVNATNAAGQFWCDVG